MNVTFKKYSGNPKKINKTFTQSWDTILVRPTDFVSDEQPQLILNYDSNIYNNANYAIIDNEYYFITDHGTDTAERMVLTLEKDLLMTYRNQILNLDVIADRSSNLYNSYINDPIQRHQANHEVQNYEFYKVGNYRHGRLVLVTIGGRT